MAGGAYGTSIEEMQSAGNHVYEVNDSVQGQLSALRNQLAPLAGAWRGQAATAFQTLMERWDANARTLNEALRGIGEAIQASGTTYQAQEEQQQQSMSNIANTLG